MPRRLTHHMRHNTVAYLALFFALTGTAVAAAPMLTGERIADGTINSDDLRDRGSAAYPGPSIQGKDVEENTLGGDEILESSLGKVGDADTLDGKNSTDFLGATAKAADADKVDGKDSTDFLGATAKAADADKLDGKDSTAFLDSVQRVKSAVVSVAANANAVATASCPSGTTVTGGGYNLVSGNVLEFHVFGQGPGGNGWVVSVFNTQTTTASFEAYAICAS